MRPQTVGLIAHTGKKGAAELVRDVCREFAELGISVLVETETARLVGEGGGLAGSYGVADLGRAADLLVVLGGDGTILNVVGQLDEDIRPIFGINIGSLGFLTCAASVTYQKAVRSIAEGTFKLSDRSLLRVTIEENATEQTSYRALNDAVFSRGNVSRLVRLQTRLNGEAMTEFNADGLIVATPTGSTAYSLSAGGPILAPESGAMVITPICPHVLTNRSIIVDEDARIEVEVTEKDYPVFLSVDGREPARLQLGAVVRIERAANTLPLASLPGVSFFSVVRQKLKWSGSNV